MGTPPPGRRFKGILACGDLVPSRSGGAPTPLKLEVCVAWQEEMGGAGCKIAYDAKEVLLDLARQFEAAVECNEKRCAGVYWSSIALAADAAPPKLGATELIWIEPCYRPPDEPTQSLSDAIVEQCQQLMVA